MILYNPESKTMYSTLINDSLYFSGFGTRSLGDARQDENIINFFSEQNILPKQIVKQGQIHSTNIQEITESGESIFKTVEDTDGLITKSGNTALILVNADCVPLIFADKTKGVIGISHQGWRGSLKRMAAKMVRKFQAAGIDSEKLTVAIGPAIGACCYDIDEDEYYEFMEEFENYADQIFHLRKGRHHLNLSLLNYIQLVESGVKKEHIDFFPFCTKCDENRFFSRRRDGKRFSEMFNFIIKLK